MVMEYCAQDLATLMDNMTTPYRLSEVKCLMKQLLAGLEYLHDNGIIHRDIKLSNLLLTSFNVLKIADFGLARAYPSRSTLTPRVVTLWYRAPELLFLPTPNNSLYTQAVDLWSAGCIMGELLLHQPLLPGSTEIEQVRLTCDLLGAPNREVWPEFKTEFVVPMIQEGSLDRRFVAVGKGTLTVRVVKGLMLYDPKQRWKVEDVRESGWLEEDPKATHPTMMPTFPEIRNQMSERKRRRLAYEQEELQRKRVKPVATDDIFRPSVVTLKFE